jgi:hypothetical protein
MSVEFYVYLFSNVSSAKAYCDLEINRTKSNVGYTEVLIPDTFAAVYEVMIEYGTQEIGISWGVMNNLVFKVAVYAGKIVGAPTDQLLSFTILERTRILEKAPNTIPEFPNAIAILIFIIAASIAVKIGSGASTRDYSPR